MQNSVTNPQGQKINTSHELKEITELLVKHHGLHDGLYDLSLEFQIAVGAVGPDPSSVIPGVAVGIRRIGIIQAEKTGPSTVDAAEVNPQKRISPTSKKPGAKK